MNSEEHRKARQDGLDIYGSAIKSGTVKKNRWEECIDHHSKSEELMAFLVEHDRFEYGDHFCWKVGGDGDNGETLMYEMDAYFEQKDLDEKD